MPTPGKKQVPPNTGDILFFWKSAGTPEVLVGKKYVHLGRVSGRSTLCGIVAPIDNVELHQALTEEAAKRGGDVVLMECGYGGYQCRCYGDVMRFID